MKKPIKTAEEIRQMVFDELRLKSDYNSITPQRPYWHERDVEGCNWDLVNWSGDKDNAISAKIYLQEFVNSLRAKFDIEES